MEKKPYLIIVDGPQGAGKSTITNLLREKITSSVLIRHAGVPDRSETGCEKSYTSHKETLKYIKGCIGTGLSFVMDRSHFSEKVYCNLGYKPYSFESETEKLNWFLDRILGQFYNVLLVVLIAGEKEYAERLDRKKGEYQKFDPESSKAQSKEFQEEIGRKFRKDSLKSRTITVLNQNKSPVEVADEIIEIAGRVGDDL